MGMFRSMLISIFSTALLWVLATLFVPLVVDRQQHLQPRRAGVDVFLLRLGIPVFATMNARR